MKEPLRCGAVLAGGGSVRFGRTKALAELRGRPLVRWCVEAMIGACDIVRIVTDDADVALASGLAPLRDRLPGHGPLAGIEVVLGWAESTGSPGALIGGCDAPLVEPAVWEHVRGDGTRTRVASAAGRVHPLCGYYRVADLERVTAALESSDRSVRSLVRALDADMVDLDAAFGSDLAARALANVNTPDDLDALRERLS